jgi:hypothetical protein
MHRDGTRRRAAWKGCGNPMKSQSDEGLMLAGASAIGVLRQCGNRKFL